MLLALPTDESSCQKVEVLDLPRVAWNRLKAGGRVEILHPGSEVKQGGLPENANDLCVVTLPGIDVISVEQ